MCYIAMFQVLHTLLVMISYISSLIAQRNVSKQLLSRALEWELLRGKCQPLSVTSCTDWKQRQEIKVVGWYFCGIKFSLYFAELYEVLKWQHPKIMGLHDSITELYKSIYGAQLQIMQLDMNNGAPSPFAEVHE